MCVSRYLKQNTPSLAATESHTRHPCPTPESCFQRDPLEWPAQQDSLKEEYKEYRRVSNLPEWRHIDGAPDENVYVTCKSSVTMAQSELPVCVLLETDLPCEQAYFRNFTEGELTAAVDVPTDTYTLHIFTVFEIKRVKGLLCNYQCAALVHFLVHVLPLGQESSSSECESEGGETTPLLTDHWA